MDGDERRDVTRASRGAAVVRSEAFQSQSATMMTNARTSAVALNAPRPAHLARKIACRFTRLVNGCVQGCPLPRAAMSRDGADHHDLRGVCQGNRCGRESAEYIDDLRTPRAFSRPLASQARSRAPSSALGSQGTLRWRKQDSNPRSPGRRLRKRKTARTYPVRPRAPSQARGA